MEFLRPLEINILSANGLKDVNMLSKMNVYAYVLIGDDPSTRKRTPVDREGGRNPTWNHRSNFTVDENVVNNQPNLCLWFRIKSQRPFGDREIGHVAVPLKELLEINPKEGERTVEYQVRTSDGKAKGTIKFAYRFGDRFGTPAAAAAGSSAVAAPKTRDQEAVTAYPGHASGDNTAYPALSPTGYGPPPAGYAAPYAHSPPAGYAAPYAHHPPHAYAGYAHPPPMDTGYGQYPPADLRYAPPYAHPPPQQAYPGAYAHPPPAAGYGYPPQQGYGYPPVAQHVVQHKKKGSKSGMGLGAAAAAGLGAGLLGGFMVGDVVGEMASDFDDVCDDDGGFDVQIED